MREQRSPQAARAVAATIAVLASVLATDAAHAQVRAGAHALYKSQTFDAGTFGVGARVEVDLNFVRRGLVVAGLYDRLFPDCEECSSSEMGGQLLLAPRGPLFLGLGAGYQRHEGADAGGGSDDSGDWVFSYAAGLRLTNLPVIVPFLEFRQEFGSDNLNEQTFSFGVMLSPTRARSAPSAPFSR